LLKYDVCSFLSSAVPSVLATDAGVCTRCLHT
jgi:hypothetical protein